MTWLIEVIMARRLGVMMASVLLACTAPQVLAQNPQNPQSLQDPVTAMNAALQRGDCAGASGLARQILARNKYGTVEAAQANLALGSCLLRAKRWSAAQRFLRLARPLPGRAAQTRRRLEKFAADREREESRSAGLSNSNSSWNPVGAQPYWQPPVVMPVEPAYGKVPQKPRMIPEKTAKPSGVSNSFSVTPALNYSRSDSYKSFSGLSQSSGVRTTTENNVNIQARTESPMAYAGGDSLALSLPVELAYNQSTSAGDTVSFKRNSDTATTVFGEVSGRGSSSKEFSLSATPSVTVPVTGNIEVEGSFLYRLSLPDFETAGKQTQRSPSGAVDFEFGSWKASAGVAYDERLNSSDERESGTTTLRGNLSWASSGQTLTLAADQNNASVPEGSRSAGIAAAATNASFTAKFGSESADYKISGNYRAQDAFPDAGLDAPGQQISGLGDVEVPFGVFSIGGAFTYSNLSDIVQKFTVKDSNSGDDVTYMVVAQGGQMKFDGRFKVTAFKWLSLGVAYSYVTTDYQTNNPVVDKDFRRKFEDLSTTTVVTASIFREF